MSLQGETYERKLVWRHRMGQAFEWLCRLATFGALGILIVLLCSIFVTAFSPGRGKGLASVSSIQKTRSKKAESDNSSPFPKFTVSRINGGRFERRDQPGKGITVFTEGDVQGDRIVFDHDGRRGSPVFQLTVTSADGTKSSEIKVDGSTSHGAIPFWVNPPPPPKPWGWLTWGFMTNFNSWDPVDVGISAGLWGSIWLIGLTGLMAVPLGIGAAVYLEEYSKPTTLTKVIQLNIANLAGVPSIVYGILGYTVFSRMFGMFDGEKTVFVLNPIIFNPFEIKLPLGPVIISGACTLALLSLPVIIISSQEALRSVPASLRHAAYALGATKWQTVWHQVLPAALPGILTGVILSLSRAIGEAAPLAVLGVAAQLSYTPGRITGIGDVVQHPDKLIHAPFDRFTALPIQVYSWINEAPWNFQHVAAAGILVLLVTLLVMNGAAVFIRQRFQQKIRW